MSNTDLIAKLQSAYDDALNSLVESPAEREAFYRLTALVPDAILALEQAERGK